MRTLYLCGCAVFTEGAIQQPPKKCRKHGLAIWEQDDVPGSKNIYTDYGEAAEPAPEPEEETEGDEEEPPEEPED